MKTRTILLTLVAALALAATAAAKPARYYVPRHGARCKTHYVRRTVRVPERRHGKLVRRHHRIVTVKQTRCVYVAPKKKAPVIPPAPTPTAPAPAAVQYSTSVDPSFTQNAANPLAVTYAYSAAAAANGADLGVVGQLPAGVLNFYSAVAPGQAAGLVCSMNVGAAVTGGSCLVNYTTTGTYQVTTQYVPNTATAVTQTDTETISPYPTTTTVATSYLPQQFPQMGSLSAGYTVDAQGIGSITPADGSLMTSITDLATGQTASWTVNAKGFCDWTVGSNQTTIAFTPSGDCAGPPATVQMPMADFNDGQIVVIATYGGMAGWAASTSQPVPADTP